VIDTLNRSLDGSENDDKDMTAYIRAADAIREAFGCLVIIVHHCGVEATRPRGHTSLTGAVDAQIAVKRDPAGNIAAEVQWMKDGPEGEVIVSRLEQVEVGTDADGEPITSCVVVEAEAVPTAVKPSKWPKSALYKALRIVLDGAPLIRPFGSDGPIVNAVSIETARQEFYKSGRPRGDMGMREVARTYGIEMIELLVSKARKGSIQAMVHVIEHGHGKAPISVDFRAVLEKKLSELSESELLALRERMTALTALPAPVIDRRDDETTVSLDVGTTDEGKIE
jgi:AAA domain